MPPKKKTRTDSPSSETQSQATSSVVEKSENTINDEEAKRELLVSLLREYANSIVRDKITDEKMPIINNNIDTMIERDFKHVADTPLAPKYNKAPIDAKRVRPVTRDFFNQIISRKGLNNIEVEFWNIAYMAIKANHIDLNEFRILLKDSFSQFTQLSCSQENTLAIYIPGKSSQYICVEWIRIALAVRNPKILSLPFGFIPFPSYRLNDEDYEKISDEYLNQFKNIKNLVIPEDIAYTGTDVACYLLPFLQNISELLRKKGITIIKNIIVTLAVIHPQADELLKETISKTPNGPNIIVIRAQKFTDFKEIFEYVEEKFDEDSEDLDSILEKMFYNGSEQEVYLTSATSTYFKQPDVASFPVQLTDMLKNGNITPPYKVYHDIEYESYDISHITRMFSCLVVPKTLLKPRLSHVENTVTSLRPSGKLESRQAGTPETLVTEKPKVTKDVSSKVHSSSIKPKKPN